MEGRKVVDFRAGKLYSMNNSGCLLHDRQTSLS